VFDHLILPMFFALSGFLVAGSLERCPTLASFYGLRILRLAPALTVEVTLSAIILGPLLTSFDPRAYFGAEELRLYFLNVLGNIHYVLPGLFAHNPLPFIVNGQLWTIPFELQCYLALGGLAIAGIVRRPVLLLGSVAFGQCLWAWEDIKRGTANGTNGASGAVLILCFLVGVLFFLYKDKIVLKNSIFAGSLAAVIVLLMLPHGAYLVSIPVTYLTVYLGLLNPPKIKYLFSGDYSYGLYLYGFPVQQAFASLGTQVHHWYLNILVCLPLTFLVAYFSWNVVEKPALALRRHLPSIERKLVWLVCGRDLLSRPMPVAQVAKVGP